MTVILVDSNVILDVLTEDPTWFDWSAQQLAHYADRGNDLAINPIIFAEVSVGFNQLNELEATLPEAFFRREPLPYNAAFLEGKAFLRYRQRGGSRRSPLPDFYNWCPRCCPKLDAADKGRQSIPHLFP